MNPYKSPTSEVKDLNTSKENNRIMKTLVLCIFSIPLLYVSTFQVADVSMEFVLYVLGSRTAEMIMVTDAIVTFCILLIVFMLLYRVKNINSTLVVFVGAISMFIYWGIESKAFLEGLDPIFPLWYEINMALNDLLAAFFVFLFNRRKTSKFNSQASVNETS